MNTLPETIELKTPSGEHTILFRAYLTGEDVRANRRHIVALKEDPEIKGVRLIEEAENQMMRLLIKQIDGQDVGEDVIGAVTKFRAEDYEFVIDKINEAAGGGLDKKKEATSGGSTETSSKEGK